jgi:hypothetical protein
MTPIRAGVVLFALCAICLVVVALRAETVRCTSRTEVQLGELIELRRNAWSLQSELARLRAPEAVRRRIVAVRPEFRDELEVFSEPGGKRMVADGR